uniref:Uncharacterized protein n=1 Tax=Rhizophora mucronata TaxID=61149 RepID=A0A2P2P6D0_RHIMU
MAASSTTATILRPPDMADSYASLSSHPQGQAPELSAYYLDPNAQNWALKEAVWQYGSDPAAVGGAVVFSVPPNGAEQSTIAHPGSSVWTNLTLRPQGNGLWKKQQKKTKVTKVVQSAYCEVCKVDCNSKDVLDQHKLGKKHKKNLEKLQAVAAVGSSVSVGSNNPIIGPQENPDKGKAVSKPNSKRKAAQPLEDLETKKRKVLEGGAAAEAVRTCTICNVVCNSETVFSHHLAGQKHAAMLKKHAATTPGAATITRI